MFEFTHTQESCFVRVWSGCSQRKEPQCVVTFNIFGRLLCNLIKTGTLHVVNVSELNLLCYWIKGSHSPRCPTPPACRAGVLRRSSIVAMATATLGEYPQIPFSSPLQFCPIHLFHFLLLWLTGSPTKHSDDHMILHKHTYLSICILMNILLNLITALYSMSKDEWPEPPPSPFFFFFQISMYGIYVSYTPENIHT